MAMEITNNYSRYGMQSVAGSGMTNSMQKKAADRASETTGNSKPQSTAEYMSELAKLVPSMECRVGNGFSSAKKGRTLTINPKLLEKMQNDPEAEKQYTELIKNIEMAEKTVGAYYNAMGGYVERTSHWYIDENGKYTHFGYVRRDDKLNKKLREEAKKNAEKLVEKNREKVAEKRKRLEEAMKKRLEEKRKEASEEKASEKEESKEIIMNESESLQEPASTVDGIKQVVELLEEKHEKSMDGSVFFDTRDMQKIMDAVKGEEQEEGQEGGQTARAAGRDVTVGASVDVVI